MKKISLLFFVLLLTLSLAACGSSSNEGTLKVGATPVPHAEILEFVKPLLEKEGVTLEIVVYQDYVQPNIQLSEGEIAANYFQHVPYFESFTTERGITNLTNLISVHIEPMGIYSKKVTDLANLENGAKVAIPNDPSNSGRALALLEKAGLLKLKEGVGVKGTIHDIVDNPKNLDVQLLDAAMLARTLEDFGISIINTNYALEAGLNPTADSLFIEGSDSPYANTLTVRTEDKENEQIQKLVKVLGSEEVKKFIEEKYNGAVVPAFSELQ